MSHLLLRIWLMVSCTLALSAVIVRLAWALYGKPSLGTLAVVILAIVVVAGTNAFIIYFLVAPSMKKIKSLPIGIWVIAMSTAGVISSIIHYIRFVPSPEGDAPLSKIIATLLLIAAISGYLLLVWVFSFWFIGIKKRQRRWLLALIIIAVVIIASVGIALSYRDNPGSIPMSAVNDGSGGAIIAWQNNKGIYSQRVDSSGQVKWQKGGVLIATCPPGSGFDLQSDGMGGAIITWNDRSGIPDDHDDPAYFDPVPLHAQRISSEGELLWSDTLISAGGKWQVVPDEAGGAIFAWDSYQPYYRALHDDYLRLQKLAPDGTRAWGDEGVLLVSSSPYRPLTEEEKAAGIKGTIGRSLPTYAGTHDIVSDGDGGIIVIWEEEGQQNTYRVYAQRLNSGGNPAWGENVMVGSASYQYNSLISDGSSGAILALTVGDMGATYQQHIGSNGELLEKKEYSFNTISDGLGSSIRVRVESAPLSGPPNEKSNIVYVQRFDGGGSPLWPEKQVLATPQRYQLGNLEYIADGKGGTILLWQLQKEFVAYGGTYALKVDADGNIQWGEKGLAVFNKPSKYQGNAQILSDGSGGGLVIAVAGKNALGGEMVYAQHLDTDGRLLWGDGIRIDR